jgi:hypothetical protein
VRQKVALEATTDSFFYISAERDVVEPYITVAKECNISIRAIDTTGLALSRVFLNSEATEKNTGTVILEGNTPHATFTIFNADNAIVFSGIVPSVNLRQDSGNTGIQTIVSELTKAIHQVTTTLNIQISRLIITGELARLSDIQNTIAIENIQVILGDPTELFKSSASALKDENVEAYSVTLGLTLWNEYSRQKKRAINLLRHTVQKEKEVPSITDISIEKPSSKKIKNVLAYSFIALAFVGLGFVVYRYVIVPFL